jgi:predicted transcriptional regulator
MMMKVILVFAALFVTASLGTGALMSHGPQLNAISWSNGTLQATDAWGQQIRLTDAQLDSTQPVVGRDANDDLHIVWSDDRTGESEIFYKKVDATGNMLVQDQRLTTTASRSMFPTLAVDSFGVVHIAWLDDRGGIWNVYYTRLANDGTVVLDGLPLTDLQPDGPRRSDMYAGPRPVNRINHLTTLADAEGLRPSLAVDSSGSAHIAWCDFRNGNSEVRYSVVDQQGIISVDQKNISPGVADSYNAVIRASMDGMVIIWAERSGETNGLFFARVDASGGTIIAPVNFFTDVSGMMEMDAAVDASGVTKLVWASDHSVSYDLFFMMLSPEGAPLGMENQLTRSMLNSMHPSIAVNSSGWVHIVWNEQQDGLIAGETSPSELIYSVVGPAGEMVLTPYRMSSSPFRSWGPSITLSTGGQPSVVWSDSRDGATNSEVYLRTQVKVSVNEVESGSGVVVTGQGQDYVPAAAAAGGIGVLVAAAVAAGKYNLSFLAIPLYSRLKKENLLNHAVREQIFGFVNSHPGANFSQIMKELNLKNGVLAYHLNTLEREELIRSLRDGTFRRYYPRSGRDVPFEIQRSIIEKIAMMPGIPVGFLADELGISRQVLDYHLDHLVQSGHVRMERRGKRNLLYNTHVAA